MGSKGDKDGWEELFRVELGGAARGLRSRQRLKSCGRLIVSHMTALDVCKFCQDTDELRHPRLTNLNTLQSINFSATSGDTCRSSADPLHRTARVQRCHIFRATGAPATAPQPMALLFLLAQMCASRLDHQS